MHKWRHSGGVQHVDCTCIPVGGLRDGLYIPCTPKPEAEHENIAWAGACIGRPGRYMLVTLVVCGGRTTHQLFSDLLYPSSLQWVLL